MLTSTLSKAGILCLALALGLACATDAHAQFPRQGQQQPPSQEERGEVEPRPQPESKPFITGYFFSIGLNAYQGDVSNNGNNNFIKYVANADINVMAGMDHRFGEYEQFGVQARLSYDHIHGKISGPQGQLLEFGNSLINLDVVGAYELPYVKQGLFRVFAGGGPVLVVAPWYGRYPRNDDRFDTSLTTRVIGSGVVGVTIFDSVHIGTRITTTDFLDGYEGFRDSDQGFPDIVTFISIGTRFDRVR